MIANQDLLNAINRSKEIYEKACKDIPADIVSIFPSPESRELLMREKSNVIAIERLEINIDSSLISKINKASNGIVNGDPLKNFMDDHEIPDAINILSGILRAAKVLNNHAKQRKLRRKI